MSGKRFQLLGLAALVWPVAAPAQVFEITRELAAPEHHYLNDPPFFTSASDVLPFPATPNVSFAISGYSSIRLRLVAPPGKKFVATRAVYFSWPGDLNLVPVGSTNSGPLHVCPTSWSFTTLAGTAPASTVEGYKTDADWLKIRATGTSASSPNFEFTEIVLEWNVAAFSGSSHTYAMSDAGGWITGPEMILYETLPSGAPDPGQAVFLRDIVGSCSGGSGTWPVCGAPVAVEPGAQLSPSVAIDGSGGAWISYLHADSFLVNQDLWLNHLDASGSVVSGWPSDGFPVCELPNDQWGSLVVADGSGGAVVAWHDTRNDPGNLYYDIYLKRITASGALAFGWPADGLCPHTITPVDDEFISGLVSDGTGGAYVLWSGARLSRITESGTIHPSWPAAGLVVDADAGASRLLADGAGGAYVCWNTVTGLRIVRITPLGTIASGWPAGGVVLSTPDANAGAPTIDLAADGSHVSVGWVDIPTRAVLASRVTSGGSIATGWGGGIVVRSTPDAKSFLTIANGGASGDVVLVWRENLQVLAQRLTPAGAVAPGWPAAGWQVIPDGTRLRAFPDCAGGTTLAFLSDGTKAIRFTQAGEVAPGWPQGGVLLCGGSFQSETPGVDWACPDGTGGVIAVRTRIPPGPGYVWDRADVHALCVRGDGSADEGYAGGTPVGSNIQVQLGPASVTFTTVTVAGETWLELGDSGPPPPGGVQLVPSDPPVYYDVTTAAQYQGPVQTCITYDPSLVQGPESGLQLLHYDDTALPPMWVNVTTSIDEVNNVICGSTSSLSPFLIVESDPTDTNATLPSVPRLLANVPNPFNPKTTIRYEIPAGDDLVRLEIHDVSGRLVRTLVNARQGPGRHEAVWDGRDERGRIVASGIYFYQLRAGSFVAARRMVLLK